MLHATLTSWTAWWDTVPPGFGFLLALPFMVAATALIGEAARRRLGRR